MSNLETVSKIAKCLQVPVGRVIFNDEEMITRTLGGQTSTGFITVLFDIAKESKSEIGKSSFATPLAEALVYQWVEFAHRYIEPGWQMKQVAKRLLHDLNDELLTKSYFVGHSITIADLAIYYAVGNLMKTLSPTEKETYLNLSRWYDHLQQRPGLREGKLLSFAPIYLHNWDTSAHAY